jgi:hypothetical protein
VNQTYLDFEPTSSYKYSSLLPRAESSWKEAEYSTIDTLFSLSFLWNTLVGSLAALIFGALFSLFFETEEYSVEEKCLSPPFLSLWKKLFPEKLKKVLKISPKSITVEIQGADKYSENKTE